MYHHMEREKMTAPPEKIFYGIVTWLVTLLTTFSFGQEPLAVQNLTRNRTFDVQHIKLNVKFDEPKKMVIGEVTTKIVPFSDRFTSFDLDAVSQSGMNISKVTLANGKELSYTVNPGKLTIKLDKVYTLKDTITFTVAYTCTPKKGVYFIQPDSAHPDKPNQIWSQGEMEDNRYWFPCYDFPNDKATSETIITVKDSYFALSNGRLLSVQKDKKNKTKTYHWLMDKPHPSYAIMIAAGEYAEIKDSYKKIPVYYYVYKGQENIAKTTFGRTPDMIKFYSEKIGYEYPWDKYAQIIIKDFMYGGMENTTATTLTDHLMVDARMVLDADGATESVATIAHELAHQWWGDLLTCKDWSHAWLNESFASYFQKLYTEYAFGLDESRYEMMQSLSQYLQADEAGLKEPIVSSKFVHEFLQGAPLVYQKGELVLNMLRHLLGDDLWWKAINYYAHRNQFMSVETHDFKRAIEEATGQNLWWFFDEWVYKVGHPQFEVSSAWNDSAKVLRLLIKQVQKVDERTPVFRMPVDVEFALPSGKVLKTVQIDSSTQEFSFPLASKPLMVLFDKGNYIIKTLKFPKSNDEYLYQLKHDDDVVGRIQAIRAIKDSTHDDAVFAALKDVLMNDTFSGVRKEAADALSKFKGEKVTEALIKAYQTDKSARVRASAIRGLSDVRSEKVAELLKTAIKTDSSYAVVTASLLAIPDVDSAGAFDVLASAMTVDSFNDVIRSAALMGLKELRDPRALKYAIEYSKFDKPQNLRVAAVTLLSSLGSNNPDVIDHLIMLLKDSNTFIRRTAVRMLGESGNPKALEPLKELQKTEQSTLVKSALKRAIEELEAGQKK